MKADQSKIWFQVPIIRRSLFILSSFVSDRNSRPTAGLALRHNFFKFAFRKSLLSILIVLLSSQFSPSISYLPFHFLSCLPYTSSLSSFPPFLCCLLPYPSFLSVSLRIFLFSFLFSIFTSISSPLSSVFPSLVFPFSLFFYLFKLFLKTTNKIVGITYPALYVLLLWNLVQWVIIDSSIRSNFRRDASESNFSFCLRISKHPHPHGKNLANNGLAHSS